MLQSSDSYFAEELPVPAGRWRPDSSQATTAALRQFDSLSRLPEDELMRIAPLCVLRAFEPGAVITAEHALAHTLLIVLHGSATLSHEDAVGHDVLLALVGPGDVFAEGGLFGSRYRRTTAIAETRMVLLQLAYEELKPLLPELPSFVSHLRRLYRERLLQTTLARVPLFGELTAIERLALIVELEERFVERNVEVPQTAGLGATSGQALQIIAEGQATVVRDGHPVAVLNPGDFFGEMELLQVGASTAQIIALTPLHILVLSEATCLELFRSHPAIATGLREIARERLAEGRDELHTDVTEAVIASGVVRGRKVLARIPALCPPGCNLCEQACTERHGASRIRLNGTQIGPIDIPNVCVHCTWSPECIDACPEDALQIADDGFIFVNDRCTGCSKCAEACPYDAITMIPLYGPSTSVRDWMLRIVRRPQPLRLDANKCDGCQGYSDQACLSICPTGSLRWVNERDVYDQFLAEQPGPAMS